MQDAGRFARQSQGGLAAETEALDVVVEVFFGDQFGHFVCPDVAGVGQHILDREPAVHLIVLEPDLAAHFFVAFVPGVWRAVNRAVELHLAQVECCGKGDDLHRRAGFVQVSHGHVAPLGPTIRVLLLQGLAGHGQDGTADRVHQHGLNLLGVVLFVGPEKDVFQLLLEVHVNREDNALAMPGLLHFARKAWQFALFLGIAFHPLESVRSLEGAVHQLFHAIDAVLLSAVYEAKHMSETVTCRIEPADVGAQIHPRDEIVVKQSGPGFCLLFLQAIDEHWSLEIAGLQDLQGIRFLPVQFWSDDAGNVCTIRFDDLRIAHALAECGFGGLEEQCQILQHHFGVLEVLLVRIDLGQRAVLGEELAGRIPDGATQGGQREAVLPQLGGFSRELVMHPHLKPVEAYGDAGKSQNQPKGHPCHAAANRTLLPLMLNLGMGGHDALA